MEHRIIYNSYFLFNGLFIDIEFLVFGNGQTNELFVGFLVGFGFWQSHFNNIWICQSRYNQEKQQQEKHNITQRRRGDFGVESSFSFY